MVISKGHESERSQLLIVTGRNDLYFPLYDVQIFSSFSSAFSLLLHGKCNTAIRAINPLTPTPYKHHKNEILHLHKPYLMSLHTKINPIHTQNQLNGTFPRMDLQEIGVPDVPIVRHSEQLNPLLKHFKVSPRIFYSHNVYNLYAT